MTSHTDKLVILAAIGVGAVFVTFAPGGCRAYGNRITEERCADYGAATGLPFKSAKIKGWSECYLKCPESWVPMEGFHGCRR